MPRPKCRPAVAKEAPEGTIQEDAAEQPIVYVEVDPDNSPEEILKEYHLWEGWAEQYTEIPLGPGHVLPIPPKEQKDPEVVGFAMPLPAVEYAFRNERKYPPPSEDDQYHEMLKLIQHTLRKKILKRSYTMSIIYNHICRNHRDSDGWQKGFIKAEGVEMFFEIWKDPELPEGKRTMGDRYWIMAIFGRMLGTSANSREVLLSKGIVDLIMEGTKDSDQNVKDNSVMSLKALVQFPEGRHAVSYELLINVLSGRS